MVFDASIRSSPMGSSLMYVHWASFATPIMGCYGESKNVCTLVNRRPANGIPNDGHSRPFILGATLRYHIDQHRDIYEATVKDLLENTYETS